jgi:hypothetical protein
MTRPESLPRGPARAKAPNPRARKFYRAFGVIVVGEMPTRIGLVMRRDFDAI